MIANCDRCGFEIVSDFLKNGKCEACRDVVALQEKDEPPPIRLNPEQIREMRLLRKRGASARFLAARYGINHVAVQRITKIGVYRDKRSLRAPRVAKTAPPPRRA